MESAEVQRARRAAMATASALDLAVDDATILNNSNRAVIRLTPCDVVARVAVAPPAYEARLAREVEVAHRLADNDSPVAGPDPRVEPRLFTQDGFAITLWTYCEPVHRILPAADYARTLGRLHAGLQQVDVTAPHFMDRVAGTQHDVANRDVTPDLGETDRALLAAALEFDLAWVPQDVSAQYPDADEDLLDECRGVVLAIIAAHRWSRDDQHPSGRESGVAFLNALLAGPPWPALDAISW